MRNRLIAATAFTLAMGTGLTGMAAPASARDLPPTPVLLVQEQVWFQSFQRASETAPCVAPASLDIAWQADWPASENQWTPSWAQWPNGDTGGWVCNRQITWSPAQYRHFIFD